MNFLLHCSRLAVCALPLLLLIVIAAAGDAAAADKRPNILLAVSDDQSWPHAGAYGDGSTRTPAFDRVAKAGVLFNNGFCASPGCSPSRAALLTGRHTWQLEQAGTHASSFPARFKVYPDVLDDAGYHVGYTGKGWGPGNYKVSGRTRNPAGPAFQKRKQKSPRGISSNDYAANFADFLEAKPEGAPFCFWYGASEPHRSYKKGAGLAAGKKLADANVPPFLPDAPEIRSDLLDYSVEIEWFDRHLGRILDLLETRGELDNTLIVVTGDNGMPFPRAKANCYEYGIHVPFAVAWPAAAKGGRTVDDLVGFVDIAPTFLEAAGVDVPADVTGRSFLNLLRSEKSGRVDAKRNRAFAARERHSSSRYNNWTYPIRAMRTPEYLVVRNFRPDRWPAGQPAGFKGDAFGYYDVDACPSKTYLWEHRDSEKIGRFFHLAVAKRPAVELFDVMKDPGCLNNLAEDPTHAATARRLLKELEAYLKETGDPRVLDGGDVYESYKRYSPIREFPPPHPE